MDKSKKRDTRLATFLDVCFVCLTNLKEDPDLYRDTDGPVEQLLRRGEASLARELARKEGVRLTKGDYAFAAKQAVNLGKVE